MNSLQIVDRAAPAGPYCDVATDVLITFNGEIYNYRRLTNVWGIPLSPGDTDAHLLLRAWAKIGPACLDRLDGMFAFAVHDPREQKLYLARDRLGEKPLYWRLDGGRLAFAPTLTGYGPAPIVIRPEMASWPAPANSAPTRH